MNIDGTCVLAFVDTTDSYWLMGDAFLTGYYSIHDNEDHANARVGFVPHTNSDKPFIEQGQKPENTSVDLYWERSLTYDWYWLWQIEAFVDVFFFDYKWWW